MPGLKGTQIKEGLRASCRGHKDMGAV
jgi:hypothetical protein